VRKGGEGMLQKTFSVDEGINLQNENSPPLEDRELGKKFLSGAIGGKGKKGRLYNVSRM